MEFFVFKGKLYGETLIKEYKSSHLFVLPSLYEGMPLTLLEAWASKLPVLVTKVGENPFIVKEGINGWLVKPADLKNLAKKIKRVINMDRNKLRAIGERNYKEVEKKYDWDKIITTLYGVINNVR